MQSIKLTQEHKDKLLEMCKALFPEHKWGFGWFYTTEVGAEYEGLDYLDVTHINHKIPCVKARYTVESQKDTSKLKVVSKDETSSQWDDVEDCFVDNLDENQHFFTKNDKTQEIKQGSNYEETYVEGIHWFEFCIMHLATALYNKLDNPNRGFTILYYRGMIAQEVEHPVDFLYDEFKKLKWKNYFIELE